MTNRSTHAAEKRATQAALDRHLCKMGDLYLLINDSDDGIARIISVLREGARRRLGVAS
jgi:hypothetical protein